MIVEVPRRPVPVRRRTLPAEPQRAAASRKCELSCLALLLLQDLVALCCPGLSFQAIKLFPQFLPDIRKSINIIPCVAYTIFSFAAPFTEFGYTGSFFNK